MRQSFKATKKQVWDIVGKAFPGYTGRKFSVELAESVTVHDLNWDGGTKNEYIAVAVNGEMKPIRTGHTQFDPLDGKQIALTPNFVIVQHSYFCGVDCGIRIWAHSCYAPKWIEA
jgi:sulfur carrier protein ThiS